MDKFWLAIGILWLVMFAWGGPRVIRRVLCDVIRRAPAREGGENGRN